MFNPIYRALVVSPTPTWPLNYGNRKRIFSVCNHLKSAGFEIHFVHYASEDDWRSNIPTESRAEMGRQWDMVDHIFPSVRLHEWPANGDDHMIDEWWDPVLENHLEKVFTSRVYDLVLVNYTWLSRALEIAPNGVVKVLDTHDKFSGRRQLLEANGINKEFFHTTQEEECKGLSRADLNWAIKKEEERQFSEMGVKTDLQTLIHLDGFRCSHSPYKKKSSAYLTFGFVGAKNNINKVNLENFIKAAIPVFEKYLPPMEIIVAGSICSELALPKNSFVKLMGYVENIDSFYDAIDVAIIPMEFSTGLKIKAGEAMSQGKALISHVHAMEGYPTTHALHRCSSFEEMAIAMCELAYEPSLVDDLTVATNEARTICTSEINNVYDDLTNRIAKRNNVVCFLPEEYGNEKKSVVHWFVQAHMDWLGWRITPIYLSLHKSHFGFSDPRVRYVTEEQAADFIFSNENMTIYNLDECLPLSIRDTGTHIIEYFDIGNSGNTVKQTFIGGNDSPIVPGFGFKKIPWLSDILCENKIDAGIAMLVDESSRTGLSEYVNCLKNGSSEKVEEFRLSSFSDLDRSINNFLGIHNSMPRMVVLNKPCIMLNYVEQLLVDMCFSHGIEVVSTADLIDHSFEIDCSFSAESQREIYSTYFYSHWEAMEGVIKKYCWKSGSSTVPEYPVGPSNMLTVNE